MRTTRTTPRPMAYLLTLIALSPFAISCDQTSDTALNMRTDATANATSSNGTSSDGEARLSDVATANDDPGATDPSAPPPASATPSNEPKGPTRLPPVTTLAAAWALMPISMPTLGQAFHVVQVSGTSRSVKDFDTVTPKTNNPPVKTDARIAAVRPASAACRLLVEVGDWKTKTVTGGVDLMCVETNRYGLANCARFTEEFLGQKDFPDFPGAFGVRVRCETPDPIPNRVSVGTLDGRVARLAIREVWYHPESNAPRGLVFMGSRHCQKDASKTATEIAQCWAGTSEADVITYRFSNLPAMTENLPMANPPVLRGTLELGGSVLTPGKFPLVGMCSRLKANTDPTALFLGAMAGMFRADSDDPTRWDTAASLATASDANAPSGVGGGFSVFSFINSDWWGRSLGEPLITLTKVDRDIYKFELKQPVLMMNMPNMKGKLFRATIGIDGPAYCHAPGNKVVGGQDTTFALMFEDQI